MYVVFTKQSVRTVGVRRLRVSYRLAQMLLPVFELRDVCEVLPPRIIAALPKDVFLDWNLLFAGDKNRGVTDRDRTYVPFKK